MAKREAKAVTEADNEMLDYWYDMENDFELLSFKAWNKTIIQVCLFAPPNPVCVGKLALSLTLLNYLFLDVSCTCFHVVQADKTPCAMQFVRTFVLTRITLKSFHNLSGLDGCILPPDSAMIGSNVYSASEGLLLGWLTTHLQKVRMQSLFGRFMHVHIDKQVQMYASCDQWASLSMETPSPLPPEYNPACKEQLKLQSIQHMSAELLSNT